MCSGDDLKLYTCGLSAPCVKLYGSAFVTVRDAGCSATQEDCDINGLCM